MSATRKILVLGATGKQGSAVIDALLDLPASSPPLEILALTRNPDSAKIRSLAAAARARGRGVTVVPVQGDLQGGADSQSSVFRAHPRIDAAFVLTTPGGGAGGEDVAGKAWVDGAVDAGAAQIVLASVDRGGEERSWANPTDVPHFYQKHAVETHLRDRADEIERRAGAGAGAGAGSDDGGHGGDGGNNDNKRKKLLRWTILRPTAFMDNANPGIFGKVFAAMWSTLPADQSLQFVSVRDIGLFAAGAIADPARWDRRALSLAGDDITYARAREVFQRVVGSEMPQTYTVIGQGMLWAMADLGRMFEFFKREGYGADIEALRKEEPRLQDFETWLRESSGWKKGDSEK